VKFSIDDSQTGLGSIPFFRQGDTALPVPNHLVDQTGADLRVLADVAPQQEPASAPTLIKTPGVVITPDKDARWRPPTEVTSDVLARISERTSADKALPTTLVLVAHPDDEAIGAGGLLSGLPDAVVAHVTDGAPRDERYAHSRGFQTREEYARARRREVVNALAHAGISPDRCRNLGYVDGEASNQLLELVFDVADLIDEVRPDVVLTHPYEGGHSDHDATAFAVHLASGILRRDNAPAPIVLELTSYHNLSGTRRVFSFLPFIGSEERTIQLTASEKALKRRMYEEFASQQAVLQNFPIDIERFRPAPRYLFTQAPHEGQLDYERFCTLITGAQWRKNAEKALQTLRTRRNRFVKTFNRRKKPRIETP
jgi:LmbE family N-acetylglucosaminyl deacetylase